MKTSRRRFDVGVGFAGAVGLLLCCAHKPPPTLEEQSQTDLDYYQAQIRDTVKDTQRAERLSGLASDFQKLLLARVVAVKESDSKIRVLNSTYSATKSEYEVLIARDDKDRSEFLKQVFALRTQMAALTTDAEWEQLKSVRMRGIEDALKGKL